MKKGHWIGVDLDGTLAEGFTSGDCVGDPVKSIVRLVRRLLERGVEVRIFTARVNPLRSEEMAARGWYPEQQEVLIRAWCLEHIGQELEVTCIKDYRCACIFDDRAITVQHGTGKILTTLEHLQGDHIPRVLLEEALREEL